ncbi:hydrogenase maturation protease [Fodinicola feengrottensis]|uniref:hydrogenase maturation protease n=1 Tax=Fodinicola feengrottensis TaxID=435914 RepID=UPI0024419798|nr:hydrogenase maturation protease [Fodinicola feengrottensis]
MTARVLVAGVGNIFLNDDGFGVEVVRRLAAETLPDWVDVADYGIRGMHLAYDVTSRGDGLETMILVDAMARGEKPGTVSVLEVDPERPADYVLPSSPIDAHGMQPDVVLDLITLLGGKKPGGCWWLVVNRPNSNRKSGSPRRSPPRCPARSRRSKDSFANTTAVTVG